MLNTLFGMFGKNMLINWWDELKTPHGLAKRYVFWCCMVFGGLFTFVFFQIPIMEKSGLGWFVEDHYEGWRHHANTKDWMVAETERQALQRECDYISRRVDKLQLTVWQLMAIQGMPSGLKAIEVEKANRELAGAKKKFAVAELALGKVTQLLERLVASR